MWRGLRRDLRNTLGRTNPSWARLTRQGDIWNPDTPRKQFHFGQREIVVLMQRACGPDSGSIDGPMSLDTAVASLGYLMGL